MKRKEARRAIAEAVSDTCRVDGSIVVVNERSGERAAIDMPTALSIIRGTLIWCDDLLDDEVEPPKGRDESFEKLMRYVAKGIRIGNPLSGEE